MICPSCRHSLDDFADKCEKCGYVFNGVQESIPAVLASIDRSLRTIRTIVLWWAILSIAAAVAWLVRVFS